MEQYRDYVRKFMSQPAVGFENMTYGEGFYEPMAALVQYLAEHGFRVYICSGTERSLARELSEDKLGKWIPPYQVIGSSFSLTATGKGDTADRDYTYTSDDQVLLEGNMTYKNLKWGKIVNIVDEIGIVPQLAFGNSSGDFSMAQYIVQNGGKAYMLLCDDTERDYGNVEKAASFEQKCKELGNLRRKRQKDFLSALRGNRHRGNRQRGNRCTRRRGRTCCNRCVCGGSRTCIHSRAGGGSSSRIHSSACRGRSS